MNISTQRKRKQVEVWHPKAHNLQLPHVPPEARQAIRKKLSPWLANYLKDYDGQRVGREGRRLLEYRTIPYAHGSR